MQWLVAVDPGLSGCGVAIFRDGQLHWAGLVTAAGAGRGVQRWIPLCERVVSEVWSIIECDEIEMVCEFPRLRAAGRQVGATHSVDPADLMELAGFVGCLCGMVSARLTHNQPAVVLPEQWKGGTPKEICHARIRKRLTASSERDNLALTERVVRPSALHNVLDAVGIGLWRLGRLKGNVNVELSPPRGPGQ